MGLGRNAAHLHPRLPRVATFLLSMCLAAGCFRPNLEPFVGAPAPRDEEEIQLWARARRLFTAMEKEKAFRSDTALASYVNDVAMRLMPAFQLDPSSVEVRVVQDPFLSAYALPNGKLMVSEGLLAQLDSEAQLACVLGHEITHFAERHAYAQRLHDEKTVSAVRGLLVVLLAGSGGAMALPGPSVVLDLLAGPEGSLLVWQVRGFARDLEYRADRRGWEAARASGYDGAHCAAAMERLLEEEQLLVAEQKVPEPYYYGDHPATAERLERLRAWNETEVPPALKTAIRNEGEFLERTAAVRLDVASVNMKIRRYSRARRLIDRHLAAFPHRADGYVALGDWYRLDTNARDLAAARRAYEQALALDPEFAPAHREMGLWCREHKDAACARRHLRRYLELSPQAIDRGIVEGMLQELQGGLPQ
ncbi:MAG: hypothetical protein KatS3mg077_2195 [Candidatus Binatia bacterium]|nr:MAG: hypothetical protein KatS3mg077_2195 [Candidatus Binatia bacterium]